MNQDFKSEYEDSLRAYISARRQTDALLGAAQTVTPDNATYVVTESEDLQSLEESARSRWESARDSYLR